ncbi:hypothetical protein KSP39_PZI005661 [Platanthera zijinensis]|uniref:Uncharacterized protein n=1 Tax=Platanthera zijinensis TaxID=2320716 RepID=A0AAP0BRI5_9ASPA
MLMSTFLITIGDDRVGLSFALLAAESEERPDLWSVDSAHDQLTEPHLQQLKHGGADLQRCLIRWLQWELGRAKVEDQEMLGQTEGVGSAQRRDAGEQKRVSRRVGRTGNTASAFNRSKAVGFKEPDCGSTCAHCRH